MWKYDEATGEIRKITADNYIVVKWLDIPGEWHYTNEQAKKLEVLGETDNRD
jgi:hypothetical protein